MAERNPWLKRRHDKKLKATSPVDLDEFKEGLTVWLYHFDSNGQFKHIWTPMHWADQLVFVAPCKDHVAGFVLYDEGFELLRQFLSFNVDPGDYIKLDMRPITFFWVRMP